MMAAGRHTLCLAMLGPALVGCARSEAAQDAAASVGATIEQRERDLASETAGRAADMRKADERGRLQAAHDLARMEAAEARRLAKR